MAVAEAMAAGCAPVVSQLACFNELVRDGETGLAFDHTAHAAADELATACGRLLLDDTLRRDLAARAQDHVRQFDYANVATSLLNRFGQLADR